MKAILRALLLVPCSLLLLSCRGGEAGNFVQVSHENPRYLEFSDGTPYIPIGPNICFERFVKDEEGILSLYDERFRLLSENGGNYTRVWLSAPFFEVEHAKAGEYDERVAARIDRLLESAAKHGIKVKFCLENFRKLTGSPAPFSTSVPFDKPVYAADGTLRSMDDFFTTDEGKELFLGRVRFLAKRYAANTSVFGWELWNEINAVSADRRVILDWTREMLPAVKKLLPNHLVMQSLGSFDRENSREMYKAYMTLPDNELAQVHRYHDPGAEWAVCHESMDTLAANAVGELLGYITDKPVILSEVGAVEAHHAGPSVLYETDSLGIMLHDLLFAPFFSGAAAPGQSWHWSYYIEKHNLWWHFGRFAKAIEGINPVKEQFRPDYFTQDSIRFYCLKGNTHTLIWCRNMKSGETSLQTGKLSNSPAKQISVYDPWQDKRFAVTPAENLPISFKRSLVIRIEHK